MSQWIAPLLALAMCANAYAVDWLVTPEEAAHDRHLARTQPPPPQHKAFTPGAPDLNLLKPTSLAQPIQAPFPIQLAFRAKDGAAVQPDTFRALYGIFGLDITDRILQHAKVSTTGIVVERAEIPRGDHRLVLRVADDRKRVGELELKFTVD